ncbi:MAG: M28 family peptidase [Bacteroidetes bacterium]|nr:M28 family peptidase [Bacteroidota bacterium]
MVRKSLIAVFCFLLLKFQAQDTTYSRQVIQKMCSKDFFGRGYVNDGVGKASKYLQGEFKSIGLTAFTKKDFAQPFTFPVNTFPKRMYVKLDGKELKPGVHYIVSPESKGVSTAYQLFRKDSITFGASDGRREVPFKVSLKKKLTFSVAQQAADHTEIELLRDSFPGELKDMEVMIDNVEIPAYKNQNIAGYVKGTQHPDSFIVFTAHYDHLGGMGANTYFPGANDNASGVSLVLNLARYYKKHPARYSVAFILFAGEEAGLLGSRYYTEHPLFPLNKIKFLTNLDLLGTGNDGIMVVNATVFKPQFEKLKAINDEQKLVTQIKQRGKAANSDHYWFAEKGVPCFFIYTMGGIQAYHDVYDVAGTLPLTDYVDVFKLLVAFGNTL